MVAIHGAIVVAPLDGDGSSSEDGDGLVAQIIPLRHRGRSPEGHSAAQGPAPDPADDARDLSVAAGDMEARGERSVWDHPTAELRRRTDAGSARRRVPPVARGGWASVRVSWHALVAAAAVLAVVACILVASGAFHGGPAIGHVGSTVGASTTGTGRASLANVSAGRKSQRVEAPGARIHRQRSHRLALGRNPQRGPASTAASEASALLSASTSSSGAGSATSTPASESPRVQVDRAAEPSASTPSTPQSQCVPGELGC